jgi:hypothetical protein
MELVYGKRNHMQAAGEQPPIAALQVFAARGKIVYHHAECLSFRSSRAKP